MRFFKMDKPLILYPPFAGFENVTAFSTIRQSFPENNAPRFTGEHSVLFEKNRKRLASLLGISENQLVFPRQTHTDQVAEIESIPETELKDTDAMITGQTGICLCVQTADCVPVLLFDPEKKAIAAIHSGWRGTVKNIAGKAAEKMKNSFSSNPGNIVAIIGPSISLEKYEVGSEVVEAVLKNIPRAEKTLHKNPSGKYHFNLWKANRQLLLAQGLKPENIHIQGECSFQNKDKYFSARRDGIETGRTVTGIVLK